MTIRILNSYHVHRLFLLASQLRLETMDFPVDSAIYRIHNGPIGFHASYGIVIRHRLGMHARL